MALVFDENYHFVLLIEEHKEVLEKSRLPSLRKKRDEVIEVFIEKWTKTSGKVLTHASLLKKINNLKARAKSTSTKNAPLSPWKLKLLEMTKDEASEDRNAANSIEVDGNVSAPGSSDTDELKTDDSVGKRHDGKILDLVNQFETDETRGLTKEQLQRVVLLKQIKVLELQQKKLELDINGTDVPLLFDISSLNVSNPNTEE